VTQEPIGLRQRPFLADFVAESVLEGVLAGAGIF
jgi:hypothetical protein